MTAIIDPRPRRGRPLQMTPDGVLDRIRELAAREGGLFQIHRLHSGLYARARRQFGSWSEAVRQAGVDYEATVDSARARSLRNRRRFDRWAATRPGEHSPAARANVDQTGAQEEDFSRP